MATLKVRPPVPPPTLTTRCDAIARPPLDTRDAWAAGPAHVCQQELSEIVQQSHWDHHGTIMGPTAAHTVKQPVLQKGVLRACGRGTRFEAQKPSAHLLKPTKTPNSLWPREELSLRHPASWVASHPRAGPDISEDQRSAISTSAVCKVRSCHARAHGTARSKGLAIAPKNGY